MAGTGNISLDIKYIFLSFVQQFFSENTKYKWTKDIQTTKLLVADKNSIDVGVVTRRPSVILNRGGFGWTYSIRGQQGSASSIYGTNSFLGSQIPSGDTSKNKSFSDLLRGSVSLNVLSKNGVQAEEIANLLFIAFTAYGQELKNKGINQITSLTFGEESTVRATSEIEVSAVQLNISFLTKRDIQRSERLNNCNVYINGAEVLEGIDFSVITNGTQIQFATIPDEGTALQVTYADAIDSSIVELADLGTGDGATAIFTLPSSGSIYGYYKIMENLFVSGPNIEALTLTDNELDGGEETISGEWLQV